jgi:hypothetical protein
VRIAKTYAADKALNSETGNIDAAVYAKALKDGKKLSGEGLKVAEFATQFPRAAQRVERLGATGPTFMDFGLSLLGKDALLLGARPIARHALLSDMAQDSMATPRNFGPSAPRRLQDLLREIKASEAAAGIPLGQQQ